MLFGLAGIDTERGLVANAWLLTAVKPVMERVPEVNENWFGEPVDALNGMVKLVAVLPTEGMLAKVIVGLGLTVTSTAVRLPAGQYELEAST